jgi:antitoxin (DNA-binding transcriptional repressor) of toxin-antitoxin stability system
LFGSLHGAGLKREGSGGSCEKAASVHKKLRMTPEMLSKRNSEDRSRGRQQMSPAASLANMAIYGHNVTMKQVGIAELKSRLSEYLRAVRRGETISVLDRETLIAQIVPVSEKSALRVRKPAPGTPPPNRVQLPRPAALKLDVVQLLMEERQGHR